MSDAILRVDGLDVTFPVRRGFARRSPPPFRAVRHASFEVRRREIVGLVGESGSGKTTLARALLRLVPASSGTITFDGLDVRALHPSDLARLRRRLQVVFQDPYTSLNPRLTAGRNIAEGLLLHRIGSRAEIRDRVMALLGQVELSPEAAERYPDEFSGGQRQRIGIARALAVEPDFLIADEPVSALDISMRAQILNLLLDQQERRGLAMLFIGHDLSVVRQICDRVIVMCHGVIVEVAPAAVLFEQACHPYTRSLLNAMPPRHPAERRPAATNPIPRWRPTAADDASPPILRPAGADHLVADFDTAG